MKKTISVMFAMMAGLLLVQCNAAIDGYNAPEGSTIEYTPETLALTNLCEGEERLLLLSALVRTPREVPTEGSISNVTSELVLAENIFGQMEANGPLRLYVKSEDAEILEPFSTQVTRVNNDNISFTTDSRGIFDIVVGIPGVAPGLAIQDCVNTSIGVISEEFCVNVTCLAVQ